MPSYSQTASADTRMGDGVNADNNYGNGVQISIGNVSGGQTWRSLVKWDLSSIPAGSIISAATMSLWLNAVNDNTTRTIRIYRVKKAWTEGNGTAGSGATWNKYDGTNLWSTAGCGDSTNDYDGGNQVGSFQFTAGDTAGHRYDITCSTSLIQAMLSGGGFTNNGFFFKADTESADQNDYVSRESLTTSEWPLLAITYTLASLPLNRIIQTQAIARSNFF